MNTPAQEEPRFDFTSIPPSAQALGRVHFIAIGGSGVSGVALLFLAAGNRVSGSDARDSPALELLRSRGATVFLGHEASHIGEADTIIISGAVTESNPELQAARAGGRLVLHRAQGIAALAAGRTVVAVAGANGKTTTSAMVVSALAEGGTDPGFVIGSPLADYAVSAEPGSGPLVVEADESDGSFLTYRPDIAIVTNVTADHLDFYGDFAGVQRAFAAFVDTISAGGLLVTNADDPGAVSLANHARAAGQRVLTWGESESADIHMTSFTQVGRLGEAQLIWNQDVRHDDVVAISAGTTRTLVVPAPGRHNLANAAAALAAATAGIGIDLDVALAGLSTFAGTRRRFESVGSAAGVEVIDDYAHNPHKVAAVVQAGRSIVADDGRLVVVFQPHLYSRTVAFADDFAEALSLADVVVLLDVYGAREQPVPGVSGETVVGALRRLITTRGGDSPALHYVAESSSMTSTIGALLRAGDVVLTVGAGDITVLGPQLVTFLERSGG